MPPSPYPLRTRFKCGVVAEVVFPVRQQGKVVILCPGAPSLPSRGSLLSFFAERGYVAIALRYRGTWESGGIFLEHSPADDVRDVIVELRRQQKLIILDVLSEEERPLKVEAVHLFGFSFGGPAVLLNTHHQSVKKVIAISPVIDWHVNGKNEPFAAWVHYMQRGYGGGYRTHHIKDWNKLTNTDFYNPVAHTKNIDGKKVFIIHANDDTVVPCDPVIPFAEKTGAAYYLKPHGGHRLDIRYRFLWKKIALFLRSA